MLSAHDAQVAARDPKLVGLPVLLDAPALLSLLQERLAHVELKSIVCSYLRYKPQTNCLALYQLQTSLGEIDIYAKAFTADDADKLAKIAHGLSKSPLGPGQFQLDEHLIGVWIFPNDDSLESLRLLGDDSDRKRLLKKLLPEFTNRSSHAIRCLAYKPERRYVGQLLLDGRPHAVLRFYNDEDFLRSTRNAKLLHSADTLRVAHRLGRSNQHGVTAMQWVEGRLLYDALVDGSFDPGSLNLVGRALAELHAIGAYKLPPKTRHMEVDWLNQSAQLAAILSPQLADQLQDLVQRLGQYLLDRPMPQRCVHGDLHPRQILLQPGTIAVIDLDEAYRGDSAADLGKFLAHLASQAPGQLQQSRKTLLEGYSAAGGRVEATDVQVYMAASLLRVISEPFRRRQPDWSQKTEALLRQAQSFVPSEILHRPRHVEQLPRNCPVQDSFGVSADPMMPFLADAIDPAKVSALLTKRLPWPTRLSALRVIRYKPQRRCLIEYDLQSLDGRTVTLVGKVRAKGVDAKTFHLQQQLWESGFDDQSDDGVSVPRPLALIPPLQMWLQSRVSGLGFIDLISTTRDPELPWRVARAIFKLHRCPVRPARSHTIAAELQILEEKLPLVWELDPGLKPRLQRLMDLCRRVGESLHITAAFPIHRDFYHDQVLINGTRTWLLDLDLLALGDPALDVGNFIAHLSEYALRKRGHPDALGEQEKELTTRYIQLFGEDLSPRIARYSALTLARLIYISTRLHERTPYTKSLLTLCEQRLAHL